jgi:hypothetical protein
MTSSETADEVTPSTTSSTSSSPKGRRLDEVEMTSSDEVPTKSDEVTPEQGPVTAGGAHPAAILPRPMH